VFLGLVGQFDPPREEVREAVRECRTAGIRTVMVTGDHRATGLAVAKSLEIAREGDLAVDGRELEALDRTDFKQKLSKLSVFARVHPAQKYKIVEEFQSAGEVVAMTGDGVNDAPALARADIGVAMGITGTEVAKEASKIVITDDNFATIVRAVEEGRVVYRNIKKAVLLLLSTSVAEVLVLLGSLLLGFPLPFLAVQILWNNVVTEGTVTVNLVMEPREGDEMQKPPIPRDEPILTRPMLRRLILMSITIAACTLSFFIYRLSQGVPLDHARTATFTLLAVCEWFNVLNCRSETKSALSLSIFKNRWLVGGLVLSNLLQVAVVFLPFFNKTFHTVPIPLSEVFLIGAVGSVVLWVEEARKLIVRRRGSSDRSTPLRAQLEGT
jgi:magnesium-transporting ATPase (P-type)